jgi:hypothetical protein
VWVGGRGGFWSYGCRNDVAAEGIAGFVEATQMLEDSFLTGTFLESYDIIFLEESLDR